MHINELRNAVHKQVHHLEMQSSTYSLATPAYIAVQLDLLAALPKLLDTIDLAWYIDPVMNDFMEVMINDAVTKAREAGIYLNSIEVG